MEVDAIIGDAAYSGKENLKIASEQNIKIVARLNPSITPRFSIFCSDRSPPSAIVANRTSGDTKVGIKCKVNQSHS